MTRAFSVLQRHLAPSWVQCPLKRVKNVPPVLSVPTQVYFVATYGEVILDKMAEFKMYVLAVLAVIAVVWLGRKLYLKKFAKKLA